MTEACETCGAAIPDGRLCTNCWEVERRIESYVRAGGAKAVAVIEKVLKEWKP